MRPVFRLLLVAMAVVGTAVFATDARAEIRPPSPESGWEQVHLIGMVLRQVGPSFAIIHDPVTGKTQFYPLGSDIKGARLSRILSDRVVLTLGEIRLELRLGVAGGRLSDAVAAGTSSGPGADRSRGAGGRGGSSTLTSQSATAGGSTSSSHVAGSSARDDAGSDAGGGGVGGGGGASESGAGAGAGAPSANLKISGLHHNGILKEQSEFASADLRDLHFDVSYSEVSGSHRQRIELFAPDGTLYQRKFRDVIVTEGQPVNTKLPVGGTWITDHSLFGSWRVVVYLDTNQTPIASGAFALKP